MRESRHGIQRTRATVEAPPGDRADLAMALWESLSDDEREGELALSPEQRAELDRRRADHEKRPDNVVPWSEVRRKLLARE